jgi:hypothetical protein
VTGRKCECFHGGGCGGLAVERRELDFERLPVLVDVNTCDVARFEAFSRYGLGQNDSIVLPDRFEESLFARIRDHEPRRIPAAVDDPNRPDQPLPTTSHQQHLSHRAAILSCCRRRPGEDVTSSSETLMGT